MWGPGPTLGPQKLVGISLLNMHSLHFGVPFYTIFEIIKYMHKTMASIASLEKIEIIRSKEFMPSEVRLKFLRKMIILGPKTAILGPQFCRILVLGPHF